MRIEIIDFVKLKPSFGGVELLRQYRVGDDRLREEKTVYMAFYLLCVYDLLRIDKIHSIVFLLLQEYEGGKCNDNADKKISKG